jgi:mono/diheme cytochrome c family protein
MVNILRVAVVFVFLVTCAFVFTTRETHATSFVTGTADYSDAASPRSLYLQYCARCHGSNGKAQTALGKRLEADDLTTSDASTAKIIRLVTNGKGDMPSFKKKMTSAQIASLAGYVSGM